MLEYTVTFTEYELIALKIANASVLFHSEKFPDKYIYLYESIQNKLYEAEPDTSKLTPPSTGQAPDEIKRKEKQK